MPTKEKLGIIVFKFKTTARQSKKQNYFTIPKRYVDDGFIEIGKDYIIYLEEVKTE